MLNMSKLLEVSEGKSARTRVLLFLLLTDVPLPLIRNMKRHELTEIDENNPGLTRYTEYVISEGDLDGLAFTYSSCKKMPPGRLQDIILNASEKAGVSNLNDLKAYVRA